MYEVTLSRSSDDPTVGALLSPKYQVRENEIDHDILLPCIYRLKKCNIKYLTFRKYVTFGVDSTVSICIRASSVHITGLKYIVILKRKGITADCLLTCFVAFHIAIDS